MNHVSFIIVSITHYICFSYVHTNVCSKVLLKNKSTKQNYISMKGV